MYVPWKVMTCSYLRLLMSKISPGFYLDSSSCPFGYVLTLIYVCYKVDGFTTPKGVEVKSSTHISLLLAFLEVSIPQLGVTGLHLPFLFLVSQVLYMSFFFLGKSLLKSAFFLYHSYLFNVRTDVRYVDMILD